MRLGMRAWHVLTAALSSAPALGVLSGLAVAAAVVLTTDAASAKTSTDSRYGFERTWNASLRLVRVDLGFKVVEKDEGAGYLLFDYRSPESGNKTTAGSIELVRSKDDDGLVHVIVQLPQMPRYHEMTLADALTRKMRTEYGEPPPRTPQRPKEKDAGPPPDASEP